MNNSGLASSTFSEIGRNDGNYLTTIKETQLIKQVFVLVSVSHYTLNIAFTGLSHSSTYMTTRVLG